MGKTQKNIHWSDLRAVAGSQDRGFEAFGGILFARWVRSCYVDRVRGVRTFHGAGGDGGVESIAELEDGSVVGLQCKWFRDGLADGQIRQIRESLARAVEVYPRLTEYVVAIPRNLTGRVSSAKKTQSSRTRRRTSQTERWIRLIEESRKKFPEVRLTLWDESRILDLLGQFDGALLVQFWFGAASISLKGLHDRFVTDRRAWLATRYSPDFHCVGKTERDLNRRLLLSPSAAEASAEAVADSRTIDRACTWLDTLVSGDPHDLMRIWKGETRSYVSALRDTCISQASAFRAGVVAIEVPFDSDKSLDEIVAGWRQFSQSTDLAALERRHDGLHRRIIQQARCIDGVIERASARRSLMRGLSQPVAYVGAAGAGKTHALAHCVENHLRRGFPAVVISGRQIDPKARWAAVFSRLPGASTLDTMSVLDALESLTYECESQAVGGTTADDPPIVRALVAVDGLDESSDWDLWRQLLSELAEFAAKRPRLQFAVSMRPQLSRLCLQSDDTWIQQVKLLDTDADLEELLTAYVPEVQKQPWLRLHLRSALAIRLFHDIGEKAGPDWRNGSSRTIDALLCRKIEQVEAQARQRLGRTTSPALVYPCLLAALSAGSSFGAEVPMRSAIQTIDQTPDLMGTLSGQEAGRVLEVCVDWGLLVESQRPHPDRPGQLEPYLTPAFQSITDYIFSAELARKTAVLLREGREPEHLHADLRWRLDVVASALARLHGLGLSAFRNNVWADDLAPPAWNEAVLVALSLDAANVPIEAAAWVETKLTTSAATCHQVVDLLVLPVAGDHDHRFGAKFLHDVLMGLRLTDRDIIWSVPEGLTGPNDAPWIDSLGNPTAQITLKGNEPWDTLPLLVAWSLTSLHPQVRRRARAELAKWGAQRPADLAQLLKATVPTNDGQMRADLIGAARGAASIGPLDVAVGKPWADLACWLWNQFAADGAPLATDDAMVRHSLGELFVRLNDAGIKIEGYDRGCPRVRGIDDSESRSLRIVVDAAREPGTMFEMPHVGHEFSRYVVDRIAGKFLETRLTWPGESHYGEGDDFPDLYAYQRALRAAVAGRLPRVKTKEARQSACESIESGEERELLPGDWFSFVTSWAATEEPAELTKPIRVLAPVAERLLRHHADAASLPSLSRDAFVRGAIWAQVLSLEWDLCRFWGDPNGGRQNEVVGLDIAILRQRPHVRQTKLGQVLMCSEKYALLALHGLCGYLADRVPFEYDRPNDVQEPPVDLSRGFQFEPNPATDILITDSQPGAGSSLPGIHQITEGPAVGTGDPVEEVTRWIRNAADPDPVLLVSDESESWPSSSRPLNSFVLNSFTSAPAACGLADALLWISAMAVKPAGLAILIEDADAGLLSTAGFADDKALTSSDTYSDPLDVLSPNWRADIEFVRRYATIDNFARPTLVKLLPLASRLHWARPNEGEQERLVPVGWLRRKLRIVSMRGQSFVTSDGEAVASFDAPQEDDGNGTGYKLAVRTDLLLEFLASRDLQLLWFVRLLRQPATWLTLRERAANDNRMEERDEQWLVWYENGTLRHNKLSCS